MENEFQEYDLSEEEYREYDFEGRVYRIDFPKTLFLEVGSNFHRVLDHNGTVHLVPAPAYKGCVVRIGLYYIENAHEF